MMGSSINILFIDDSGDDAELAALTLQRAGVAVRYHRVATLADVERAIADPQWDIILCDCKLPGFTATNVWELLGTLNVQTPFAVFADLMLNMEIRKLLNAGVHRFVDKNRLDRLEASLQPFMRTEAAGERKPQRGNGR